VEPQRPQRRIAACASAALSAAVALAEELDSDADTDVIELRSSSNPQPPAPTQPLTRAERYEARNVRTQSAPEPPNTQQPIPPPLPLPPIPSAPQRQAAIPPMAPPMEAAAAGPALAAAPQPRLPPPPRSQIDRALHIANHPVLMKRVPAQAAADFISAARHILIKYARESRLGHIQAQARALLELFLLPGRALGKTSGSKKRRAIIVRQRLNQVRGASDQIEIDEANEASEQALDSNSNDAEIPRNIRRAIDLIEEGHLGKGAHALTQGGHQASIDDPDSLKQVQDLHPQQPRASARNPPAVNFNLIPLIAIDTDKGGELAIAIRRAANGSAPGPSGWSGDLLKFIARDQECLTGLGALIADIANGAIPESSCPFVLASNLSLIPKPNGSLRPIACGEVVYRIAASIAIEKIKFAISNALLPHQFGVSVPGGCEIIIHDMQNTLEPGQNQPELAALSVDFKNAFNTISRSHCLDQLKSRPEFSPLFRLANFAYGRPTPLLCSRSDRTIIHVLDSVEGVRQGDPLGSLLFSLGIDPIIREALAPCATSVSSKSYIDDVNFIGPPSALPSVHARLVHSAAEIGLIALPEKSQFIHFHDSPLPAPALEFIEQSHIPLKTESAIILGAPIGKNTDAITIALKQILKLEFSQNGNFVELLINEHRDYFTALLSADLPAQHAYLILRFCAIPKLGFLLRTVRPSAMRFIANAFDQQIIATAQSKLNISRQSATSEQQWKSTLFQLQLPQRFGGLGLTPANLTVDVAYVASLASAIEFTTRHSIPLHSVSKLASPQLSSASLTELATALPAARNLIREKAVLDTLPTSAIEFQNFFRPAPLANHRTIPRTTHLQHIITAAKQKELDKMFRAARPACTSEQERMAFDARMNSVSAPRALLWLSTLPEEPQLKLGNHAFTTAIRLSLGLKPLNIMPKECPNCHSQLLHSVDHHLTCSTRTSKELTARHNQVVKILTAVANNAGASATAEPSRLDRDSQMRPDIIIALHDKTILVDVAIIHPTAASYRNTAARRPLAAAKLAVQRKNRAYEHMRQQHHAILVPFVLESFGGFTRDASQLVHLLACFAEENLPLNTPPQPKLASMQSIAIAIQRANARAATACYSASSRAA